MTLDEFRRWTYADDFPKNAAIAYIAGDIIDMSPERIDSHASPKLKSYHARIIGAQETKRAGLFLIELVLFTPTQRFPMSRKPSLRPGRP